MELPTPTFGKELMKKNKDKIIYFSDYCKNREICEKGKFSKMLSKKIKSKINEKAFKKIQRY